MPIEFESGVSVGLKEGNFNILHENNAGKLGELVLIAQCTRMYQTRLPPVGHMENCSLPICIALSSMTMVIS